MKKYNISGFILIFSLISITSCSKGTDNSGDSENDNFEIGSFELNQPKAFFIAKENSTGGSLPVGKLSSDANKLFQIKNDGNVEKVRIKNIRDQYINDTDISFDSVRSISSILTSFNLTISGNRKQGILRHSDGKIFDFTDYDMDNAQTRDGFIYTINSSTKVLYRINLSALTATPMNNPQINAVVLPTNERCMYIPGMSDIDASLIALKNGNVIAYSQNTTANGNYIFWNDNSIPKYISNTNISSLDCDFVYNGVSHNRIGQVISKSGDYYRIGVSSCSGSAATKIPIISKIEIIGEEISESVTNLSEDCSTWGERHGAVSYYRLWETSRYVTYEEGYLQISDSETDGIDVAWVPRHIGTLPVSDPDLPNTANKYIHGDYLYWKSGPLIKRILIPGASSEELLVNEGNIIKWKIVGDEIIFVKQLSATAMATYRRKANGDIEELSNQDMEIQYIVEIRD